MGDGDDEGDMDGERPSSVGAAMARRMLPSCGRLVGSVAMLAGRWAAEAAAARLAGDALHTLSLRSILGAAAVGGDVGVGVGVGVGVDVDAAAVAEVDADEDAETDAEAEAEAAAAAEAAGGGGATRLGAQRKQ